MVVLCPLLVIPPLLVRLPRLLPLRKELPAGLLLLLSRLTFHMAVLLAGLLPLLRNSRLRLPLMEAPPRVMVQVVLLLVAWVLSLVMGSLLAAKDLRRILT